MTREARLLSGIILITVPTIDRRRMRCAKCGKRFKAGRSGSWTRTSEIFSVRGSREASHAGSPASSRWPSASSHTPVCSRCKSAAEARAAVAAAGRIRKRRGLFTSSTASSSLATNGAGRHSFIFKKQIRSQVRQGTLYAYPKEKSIHRFMDLVRQQTKRTIPLKTKELIAGLTHSCGVGASITNAPTFVGSSIASTAGSGDGLVASV